MKILILIALFQVSLQLQCAQRQITAHVGGEFILFCKYDANAYRYSKKYWCQGDSRSSCQILVDSESGSKTTNTHRSHILDAGRRGLFVKVTGLQFNDAGLYWVGIDKIYADIMSSVKVVITEVPVSKPRLWPLSSLADRPTCWGKPVTVRCGSAKGTAVHYIWYQEGILLHQSPDLLLHCGALQKDSNYTCTAKNDISSQGSDVLTVQVMMPADSSCIFVIDMQDQPVYDCMDRMSTTTVTTPPLTSCCMVNVTADTRHQSLHTVKYFAFNRGWTGLSLWYTLLRWGSVLSLLIFLWVVIECTKTRYKTKKRSPGAKKMSRLSY